MKTKGRRQSENIRDARVNDFSNKGFKWDKIPGSPVKDSNTPKLAKEIEELLGVGKQKLPAKGPIPPERPATKSGRIQVTPGKWKTKSK